MVINGFCDPKFSKIKTAYEKNFINGLDVGSSLGITYKGELVVYLWGGFKSNYGAAGAALYLDTYIRAGSAVISS